jgi:MFS family permease
VGVRALALFSATMIVLGMVLFAITDIYWVMVAGRVLFGFGLGPTELVNDIIALRWFDSETTVPSIEVAFGTIASFGMIGFVIAFNMMPFFFDYFSSYMHPNEALKLSVLCLAIIPTICLMINIYYAILDWYAEPILELEFEEDESEEGVLGTVKNLPFSYWLLFSINASCFAIMYVIMLIP